ncbi:hypothetical protein [Paenibacillus marinisediminis]
MNSAVEAEQTATRRGNKKNKEVRPAAFLLFWAIMIAIGVITAYYYSQHMKQSMLQELEAQTAAQIQEVQASYEKQLKDIDAKLTQLQSKVDSFNELLTFTKDNASDKTDNSNKLYTQLNQVMKQMDALKKEMDLLK